MTVQRIRVHHTIPGYEPSLRKMSFELGDGLLGITLVNKDAWMEEADSKLIRAGALLCRMMRSVQELKHLVDDIRRSPDITYSKAKGLLRAKWSRMNVDRDLADLHCQESVHNINLLDSGCYGCGDKTHRIKDCPIPCEVCKKTGHSKERCHFKHFNKNKIKSEDKNKTVESLESSDINTKLDTLIELLAVQQQNKNEPTETSGYVLNEQNDENFDRDELLDMVQTLKDERKTIVRAIKKEKKRQRRKSKELDKDEE